VNVFERRLRRRLRTQVFTRFDDDRCLPVAPGGQL